jgi:hypothetical protein
MDNPYQSPSVPAEPVRRPYTRIRFIVDLLALVFAGLPLVVDVALLGVGVDDVRESLQLIFLVFLLAVIALWFPSLIINIVGALKRRPIPIIGLLLNVASLIAVLLPDEYHGG